MKESLTGSTVFASEKSQETMFGFESEEKAKPIPFDVLNKSIRVEGKFGSILPTRPVQFWNVMNDIEQILQEERINYTTDQIFVQAKNSFLMLPDSEKKVFTKQEAPISRWLFDRLICRFHIENLANDEANTAIAVSYHDDGIQIAFGANVRVCQNMNIMGGHILSTYANKLNTKDSYDGIIARLSRWARSIDQLIKVEFDMMNLMKSIPVGTDAVTDFTGKLYLAAIDQAYGSKEIAPFNTDNMSNFARKLVSQKEPIRVETLWDLYNVGTSIMKPGIMDIQAIYTASALLSRFIMESFNVEHKNLNVI